LSAPASTFWLDASAHFAIQARMAATERDSTPRTISRTAVFKMYLIWPSSVVFKLLQSELDVGSEP
jgi:hypothetical protein